MHASPVQCMRELKARVITCAQAVAAVGLAASDVDTAIEDSTRNKTAARNTESANVSATVRQSRATARYAKHAVARLETCISSR